VLRQRVQRITDGYVHEVELCCDLAHDNLVRMIGYATKPRPLLVQELMQVRRRARPVLARDLCSLCQQS
jgi:hypothetical protein